MTLGLFEPMTNYIHIRFQNSNTNSYTHSSISVLNFSIQVNICHKLFNYLIIWIPPASVSRLKMVLDFTVVSENLVMLWFSQEGLRNRIFYTMLILDLLGPEKNHCTTFDWNQTTFGWDMTYKRFLGEFF